MCDDKLLNEFTHIKICNMTLTFELLMKSACYNYSKAYLPWKGGGAQKTFKNMKI